jgi:elongation factor G
MLLDELVYSAPSAADKAGEKAGDKNIPCDENGPLAAICFKTVADPFVGRMSFFKVVSGKLTPDTPAFNARTGESERMGKLIFVKGSKQEDTAVIPAGDIGVVTKLSGVSTGDTLCSAKDVISLEGVNFPAPCLSMAVKVKKKVRRKRLLQVLQSCLKGFDD